MITRTDWIKYFPFAEPRIDQEDAINFVLESFKGGKRFAVLDLGTGIGKSAVGVTIARYLTENDQPKIVMIKDVDGKSAPDCAPGALFLTTQKILQEQYMDDFGKGCMKSIKSASNYKCSHYKKLSCSEGQQLLRAADKASLFWKKCMFSCNYKLARKDFLESTESITNFSYALTEANFSGKIKKHNLLVIDEAHNVENELCKFIEVSVTDRTALALGIEWPTITTYLQAMKWVCETYLPAAKIIVAEMEADVEQFKDIEQFDDVATFEAYKKDYGDMIKRFDALRSHVDKLDTFLMSANPDNWIIDVLPQVGKTSGKITFRPIDISPYSEQNLFRLGRYTLLMSATIINPEMFCESLGIPLSQVAILSKPSPFPIENRPIYFHPIGKMTADSIDESLPKIAAALREILKEHKDTKGIVHCHSYKIVQFLKKNMKSSRLIFHESHDRDAALEKHAASKEPTVLVSPSMSEGVDLRDNLARFQVLLKVPYPSLGDKIVKKRMHKWPWWYPMQTVKTIIQAVGRAVRSDTDHAVTYILDSDWRRFYGMHQNLFPQNFRDTIK